MIQNNLPTVDLFAITTTFGLNPYASTNNNNQKMPTDNDSNASDEDHGNDGIGRWGDDDEHSDESDSDGLPKGGV